MQTGDGGDSVDGEFLRQEWIMRRLALCQACTALMVLRQVCILGPEQEDGSWQSSSYEVCA